MAQRVGRGIALLFHDRSTRNGWVVSSTTRPQFTPGKDTVPILQKAGWALGTVWTGGKSHPHRDSILAHPALSQSLYRLSNLAHRSSTGNIWNVLENFSVEILKNFNWVNTMLKERLTENIIPLRFKEIMVESTAGFLFNKFVTICMSCVNFFYRCVLCFTVDMWEMPCFLVMGVWELCVTWEWPA